MWEKLIQKMKKHGHVLVVLIYSIFYMSVFSYIEERNTHPYIVHTAIDDQIPFCEYFVVPYILWFAFITVTLIYFAFFSHKKDEYYQLLITLGTGMTLFLVISLVFPNGQDLRPTLTGDSIFIKAVQYIYHADTPTNVLPSIHVFNSLACCLAIIKNKNIRPWIKRSAQVLTILIIMSTMLLKQHSIVDVIFAAILYAICYQLYYVTIPSLSYRRSEVKSW
ncbi:phosphatase PAP2 family protein [Anaerostipes sp. MSJ-23]|uniref:phosphatase PAP2 family protein n=1 Tax=Anaerostipes sp. MSJ-23 TaxID=2841520 RepID=UPI001C121835|nr:phosphatase PAP2 family protein [Anaerostipes sp. MSJ-23]MBU5460641.1 phosphatase PAP2 family protein [Anaerostipes sp. MSJ-23]